MLGWQWSEAAGDATARYHSVANLESGRLAEFGWTVCPMAGCLFLSLLGFLRGCSRADGVSRSPLHAAGAALVRESVREKTRERRAAERRIDNAVVR